jgi:4-oxalocrotonate tautomerase
MPIVRIDLLEGKTPEYRKQLGEIVYRGMIDALGVPKDDRFEIIAEHSKDAIILAFIGRTIAFSCRSH